MSVQYALECGRIKGKNVDIKNAISIKIMNNIPHLVCNEIMTHDGLIPDSSYAQGNFCPKFIASNNDISTVAGMLKLTRDYRNKEPDIFKITRYTLHEGEPAELNEIEFKWYYLNVFLMDPEGEKHIFNLVPRNIESRVTHTVFRKSENTKSYMARCDEYELILEKNGRGYILP